jgi:hypothetical protein
MRKAAEPVPLPPIDLLAKAVNAVGFAPDLMSETDAAVASAQAAAYVRVLRNRRSWWRRLIWSVNPRPLLW